MSEATLGAPSPASRATEGEVFLSVVVPCWNNATLIAAALDSVLEARSVPLEVLVIDDASTDGTRDVVERIAGADSRVRLETLPENRGVSAARNRGLDLARGDWLTMLDADDRFAAGGLERLIAAARVGDARAIIGQQVWTDGARRWISRLYDIDAIRRPALTSLAATPELVYFVSPHAKIVHRSTWDGLRFEGRVLGDQPWVIRALLRAGDRVRVIGDTVYEWSRPRAGRQGSITHETRSDAVFGVRVAEAARVAFDAVASEAESLPRAARQRLLATYLERLFRSDLGIHLQQALRRGDPALPTLLDADAAFVRAMPRDALAGSGGLSKEIVIPPLRSWRRLSPEARAAWWRLVTDARTADRSLAARPGGWRQRLGLRVALGLPSRLGPTVAQIVLLGTGLRERIAYRLRGAMGGHARPHSIEGRA